MASPTPVIAALGDVYAADSTVNGIVGAGANARVWRSHPDTTEVRNFPCIVLWGWVDDPILFDQQRLAAHQWSGPLELAGFDPVVLETLGARVVDLTNGLSLNVSGFRDIQVEVEHVAPDFHEPTKLHRLVLTLAVYAQPA